MEDLVNSNNKNASSGRLDFCFNFIENYKVQIFFIFVSTVLTWGTGFHGDDYILGTIYNRAPNLYSVLFTDWAVGGSIDLSPLFSILMKLYFYFCGFNEIANSILKIIINFFALVSFYLFLEENLKNKFGSILLTLLIVFFPNHDAVNYWVLSSYYLLPPAFLLLAFRFRARGYLFVAFSLMGCFFGYSCPPFVVGVLILLCFEKEWNRFIQFFCIFGIYLAYFIYFQTQLGSGPGVKTNISPVSTDFIFNLVIQLLTSFDVNFGLSFWIKIVSSITTNLFFSLIVICFASYALRKCLQKYSISTVGIKGIVRLLFFSGGVYLASLCMFASTGKYPQLAFNLGNRVSYFTAPFVVILYYWTLIKYDGHVKNALVYIFFPLLLTATFMISVHWRSWNNQQLSYIQKIQSAESQIVDKQGMLFVSGPQYSDFSGLSHIEFLVQDISRYIVNLSMREKFQGIHSVSSRFVYKDKQSCRLEGGNLHCYNVDNNVYLLDDTDFLVKKSSLYEINDRASKYKKKFERHWLCDHRLERLRTMLLTSSSKNITFLGYRLKAGCGT